VKIYQVAILFGTQQQRALKGNGKRLEKILMLGQASK
jgi:hypothetical protein